MKKMMIFCLCMIMVVLNACSSNTKSTTCNLVNQPEEQSGSYTFTYDGDTMKKSETKIKIRYASSKDEQKNYQALAKQYKEPFKDVKGFAIDYKATETSFLLTTTIDFTATKKKDLIKYAFANEASFDKNDNVSYKKLKKEIQTRGFDCNEK